MMNTYKISVLFIVVLFLISADYEKIEEATPYPFPAMEYFPEMPFTEENPVTVQGAELGRYLFYDPLLSKDHSISCSTCHQQKSAFSDTETAFSEGIAGNKLSRNTMPLFNLAWYPTMFWDGRAKSIEGQVFHPVRAHNEMGLDWGIAEKRIQQSAFYQEKFRKAFGGVKIDSVLITKAIAQFERTLLSYNSKYDRVVRGETIFSKEEYEGFVLMNDQTKGDCLHCHTTDADVLGTTGGFSNNGLDHVERPDDYPDKGRGGITANEEEYGVFKIPSLRNIMATAPYMHDGRFNTLEEVLDFYSEGLQESYNIDSKMRFVKQGGARLEQEEKTKIIAFLKTMTDTVFLTNPEFGNPFEH